MERDECIARAEVIEPVSREEASAEFIAFYREHCQRLKAILLEVKRAYKTIDALSLRAGLMPPARSVISEEIREFCRLPYRTEEGVIPACPGILENLKGCPPNSPPVADTARILLRARSLLVIQFEGRGSHSLQGKLHLFMLRLAGRLKKAGYEVIGTYACGPCGICPEGCGEEGECRFPEKRLFALESCGFWVNRLCQEASKFPVCGEGPREVRWIRDWGLANQDTDAFRFVTGVLIGNAVHIMRRSKKL